MNLHFLNAAENDFDSVFGLYQNTAKWFAEKGINQWSQWLSPDEKQKEWLQNRLAKGEFWFAKNESSELVGMFRLMYEDEEYWGKQDIAAGYVHSLITLRAFSGQNIGEKMLQFVENELIRKEIFTFRLDCVATNERLCNYYLSQGFVALFDKQMRFTVNRFFEKKLK